MFKHYTMNQVVLPIDLAVKLPKNDIAFSVDEIVESIPQEAFNFRPSNGLSCLPSANDDEDHPVCLHAISVFRKKN